MISGFIDRAKRGESVYLCEVRDAFSSFGVNVECVVELAVGAARRYGIALPHAEAGEELEFVKEYFHANIYNLISVLGGKRMTLYVKPGDEYAYTLCAGLDETFQTGSARGLRTGYGKCLNVTDRVNAAMGCAPFRFKVERGECPAVGGHSGTVAADALTALKNAAKAAENATICGMDIGGTDIKIVGVKDGRIAAVKEYDWYPAQMTEIGSLITPILLLTRVTRAALSLPETPRADELRRAMLDRNASDDDMRGALEAAEKEFGVPGLLDGIGVCFPDVVIQDKIVGGETLKTRGIREHSPDYENEFSRLAGLGDMLAEHCVSGGPVHISNDGSLAAYTAAVEIAHSERAGEITDGVFAHTLGTELGTGWIDETGEIPQMPLEVYNCIIDLGNYPARRFGVLDLRSSNNFNTGLPGTLQKYTSQSGAYRLALQYFETEAPELYREMFDKGFIEEKDGGVYAVDSPKDMRKPLLEHIMALADQGQPQAMRVFRDIGEYLAATWRETEFILCPRAKSRVLFGRFIKSRTCFGLMQEGADKMLSVSLSAGDGGLAFTPLMLELNEDPAHTVAQFGQAVGAAHFAASALKQE